MYDREFRMQLADRYARQTLAIERDIIASMDDDFPVGREADWGISAEAKRKLLKFKLDKWASFLSPEWEGRILTVEGGDARSIRQRAWRKAAGSRPIDRRRHSHAHVALSKPSKRS